MIKTFLVVFVDSVNTSLIALFAMRELTFMLVFAMTFTCTIDSSNDDSVDQLYQYMLDRQAYNGPVVVRVDVRNDLHKAVRWQRHSL